MFSIACVCDPRPDSNRVHHNGLRRNISDGHGPLRGSASFLKNSCTLFATDRMLVKCRDTPLYAAPHQRAAERPLPQTAASLVSFLAAVGCITECRLVFRKAFEYLTFRFVSWDGQGNVVLVPSFDPPRFKSIWSVRHSVKRDCLKQLFAQQLSR